MAHTICRFLGFLFIFPAQHNLAKFAENTQAPSSKRTPLLHWPAWLLEFRCRESSEFYSLQCPRTARALALRGHTAAKSTHSSAIASHCS
ncbi:hypothetical protein F5X96DRAFT_630137 [Biscogniauxia mediterranea]|nr:hypothetical protein F5X96DRAFT_630137 [Biscogniauxia mediterranea]